MEKIKKTARWMERAMNLLFLVCGLLAVSGEKVSGRC